MEHKEFEIETGYLLKRLLERWWCLVLAAVAGGLLALGVTALFVSPRYEASVILHVESESGELSESRNLVDSCIVVLRTRGCLEEIARQAGVAHTPDKLDKMLAAGAVEETEFLAVTVTASTPSKAKAIADAVGQLLPERAAAIMPGVRLTVADAAALPLEPAGPDWVNNTLIGLALGLILGGAGAAFAAVRKKEGKRAL